MAYTPKFDDTQPVADVPKFEDTVDVPTNVPKFEDTTDVPNVSKLESFARGVGQGATFGFGDEIVGAVESAFTDKTYQQARDESRAANKAAEAANPKTYIAGDIGGGIAVSLIPYVGMTAKTAAGAAAIGAVSGGVTGMGKSEARDTGGVLSDAAVAAAFGGVMGAGMHAAIQGISKVVGSLPASAGKKAILAEEALQDTLDGTPPNPNAVKMMAKAMDDGMEKGIQVRANELFSELPPEAKELPTEFPKQFINFRLGRSTGKKVSTTDLERFEKSFGQFSNEVKKEVWENYLFGQSLTKAAQEAKEAAAKTWTTLEDPFEKTPELLKRTMAGSQIAEKIDDKAGTNLTEVVYNFSKAERQVTNQATPFLKSMHPLLKAGHKAFKGEEDLLYRALDKGDDYLVERGIRLTQAQRDVVNSWREWFEAARVELNNQGLNVAKREGAYITHRRLPIPDAKVKMLRELDMLAKKYGHDFDFMADRVPRDVVQFKAALKDLAEGDDILGFAQAKKFLNNLDTRGSVSRALKKDSSAAFQRLDEIPELLRETNLAKLATGYVVGNLKAAHMRKPLEQLHNNIMALRAAGMTSSADLMREYAEQMAGKPSSYYAMVEAAAGKFKSFGQKIADEYGSRPVVGGVAKRAGEMISAFPEFVSWSTAQIYPNYLGFRVDAPLRNMTQTWLVTAPEIGWKKGTELTARGWKNAVKDMAKGVRPNSFLRQHGLAGTPFRGPDVVDAIEQGAGLVGRAGLVRGIDKVGQAGMALYSATDDANRFITYHIGQEMADDILKNGVGKYAPFLKRMPGGYRQEILAAVKSGNDKRFREMLTNYLVEKTQFNYTRADLSMYGREFGRLYTMFTKWPTMIVGDVARTASKEEGIRKIAVPAHKYLTPLMLLGVADMALDEMDMADDPVKKAIIGKNLAMNAPIKSLAVSVPPLVTSTVGGIEGLLEMAEGEVASGADKIRKAGEPFIPGGFIPINIRRYSEED